MSKKQKQPYIPFYVGDYLTDTRILPLNVRGAWVDLILYMWNNEPKGEISGTYEEYARLIGCSVDEMMFCIDLLNQKKICDCEFVGDKVIKLKSRKIKNIMAISEKRQNAGKMGGNPNLVNQKKLFASDDGLSKTNQKPEYEYEYNNESDNTNVLGGVGEIKDSYTIFKNSMLSQKIWCEEVCMKTKSTLEELPKMIDNFISHCIMGGETHYSEKEFKTHFRNTCLKNIKIVKPQYAQSPDQRKEEFRRKIELYSNQYDLKMLDAFFIHWSQFEEETGIFLWEMEKAFEIPNKLASWKENGKNFNKNGHSKPTKENIADATRNFKFGGG